ncbi:MAG: SGNH/GDSL hydrolase family protein [Armatimonadia bacterium]
MMVDTGIVVLALLLVAVHCAAAEIVLPAVRAAAEPQVLTIKVPDIKGSYTIPYLQSSREVRVRVAFPEGASQPSQVRLWRDDKVGGEASVTPQAAVAVFANVAPGEYVVEVGGRRYERLGVGTVIAALGDSITEGYHSRGFWCDNLELTAAAFPPEAVSRDGRNFPQHSPTTAWHRPEVNCFQSWMTSLNDLLSGKWQQPVFIANEGYGGITTGQYLQTMRGDKGWQERMKLLQPTVWLIHLGVTDERAKLPAAEVAANLEAMVDLLVKEYGAKPEAIYLARPCYDYAEGAAEILESYIAEMDKLIERRGLRNGPDFFKAYSVDKARWYGADPVHPNVEGMELMARLWGEAVGEG